MRPQCDLRSVRIASDCADAAVDNADGGDGCYQWAAADTPHHLAAVVADLAAAICAGRTAIVWLRMYERWSMTIPSVPNVNTQNLTQIAVDRLCGRHGRMIVGHAATAVATLHKRRSPVQIVHLADNRTAVQTVRRSVRWCSSAALHSRMAGVRQLRLMCGRRHRRRLGRQRALIVTHARQQHGWRWCVHAGRRCGCRRRLIVAGR